MNSYDMVISLEISRTKTISILVSSFLLLLIAVLLWRQQEIDYSIVISNNFILESKLYHTFFKFISRYGMGIISLIYSFLVLLSLKKAELRHYRPLFLFIIFSFALSSISVDLLKEIIGRARPVVELSGQIIQTEFSKTPSFPSGHAAKSMGLALPFIIMALNKETLGKIFKILISTLAVLVCYSRVALQKHFLSDVLASMAIALLCVYITLWIVNYFYKRRKMDEDKLIFMIKRLAFIFIGLAYLLTAI